MSVKKLLIAGWILASLLAAPVPADVVQLKSGHPERYIVQKGDTLWDISKRFLADPWRWASVWKINDQIKNPHLIYPGDVIVLTWVDGKPQLSVQREDKLLPSGATAPIEPEAPPATTAEEPIESMARAPALAETPRAIEEPAGQTPTGMKIVKLRPRAYSAPIKDAIPTISPDVILPFLNEPRIVQRNELERAGYVMVGYDDRVALGNGSQFYARGLKKKSNAEFYQVFRQGKDLKNPDTGEILAYEAIYLGDARLIEPGDPARFEIVRIKQEILPTDRLFEAPERAALPYYFPRAPDKQVKGRILSVFNGVTEIGPKMVVTINLGAKQGIEEGHVLRVMRYVGVRKDPVTRRDQKIPDEDLGLLMVFRVFDKISYAIVMDASRPMRVLDAVRTP
jgi:LysM domain